MTIGQNEKKPSVVGHVIECWRDGEGHGVTHNDIASPPIGPILGNMTEVEQPEGTGTRAAKAAQERATLKELRPSDSRDAGGSAARWLCAR